MMDVIKIAKKSSDIHVLLSVLLCVLQLVGTEKRLSMKGVMMGQSMVSDA